MIHHPLFCLTVSALLLVAFGAASYTAALTKSATFDEPLGIVAGHLALHHHDYRLLPQDPSLFGYLAGLRAGDDQVRIDRASPHFPNAMNDPEAQWALAIETLYSQPAAGPDLLLQRARLPFVIVAVLGGLATLIWAYRLGGPTAAMVATALFAFDPTLLGHAPLVKNDVAMAGLFLVVAALAWRVGRNADLLGAVLLAMACGVAINTKFSGVLLVASVCLLMAARAALPRQPWEVLGRQVASRRVRALAAGAIVLAIGLSCWGTTWAFYGFRFEASPGGAATADWDRLALTAQAARAQATHPNQTLGPDESAHQPIGLLAHVVRRAAAARLAPEAWLFGLQFTQAYAITRHSFLLGDTTLTGHWYYFPLAMLFKTPTALLLAFFVVPVGLLAMRWFVRGDGVPPPTRPAALTTRAWTPLCVALPIGVYTLVSMTTSLNLGIRHMLPAYPLLFVAIGCGVARLVAWRRPAVNLLLAGLAVALVAESALTWPHYIAFFNAPAGGSRGGLALLSDSNLDWGQDLKELADWQRQNPEVKLYLCYFGSADPAAYGVRAVHLPGGWPWGEWSGDLREPGVIAVSATHLQGTYLPPEFQRFYGTLRERQPLAVLSGGTIYLYEHAGRP